MILDFSSIPFAFTVSGLAKSSMVISSLVVYVLLLKIYIHSQIYTSIHVDTDSF